MPLHLFIEGPTRQLQFFQYCFHIALVPGQRGTQALRLERLLLRRQRLAGLDTHRLRFAQPQHLTLGDIRQFAYVTWPVVAQQAAQLRPAQGRNAAPEPLGGMAREGLVQQGNVLAAITQGGRRNSATFSR